MPQAQGHSGLCGKNTFESKGGTQIKITPVEDPLGIILQLDPNAGLFDAP